MYKSKVNTSIESRPDFTANCSKCNFGCHGCSNFCTAGCAEHCMTGPGIAALPEESK